MAERKLRDVALPVSVYKAAPTRHISERISWLLFLRKPSNQQDPSPFRSGGTNKRNEQREREAFSFSIAVRPLGAYRNHKVE